MAQLASAAPSCQLESARARQLAILQLFPNGRLFELYGSTEAGWVTLLRPDEQLNHLGSVGREWAGSGPIRLLDGNGHEVPDGESGELYSRTANAFDGYWKNPEKTSEAFWLPPSPGGTGAAPRGGAESLGRRGAFHGAWCSVGDMRGAMSRASSTWWTARAT